MSPAIRTLDGRPYDQGEEDPEPEPIVRRQHTLSAGIPPTTASLVKQLIADCERMEAIGNAIKDNARRLVEAVNADMQQLDEVVAIADALKSRRAPEPPASSADPVGSELAVTPGVQNLDEPKSRLSQADLEKIAERVKTVGN